MSRTRLNLLRGTVLLALTACAFVLAACSGHKSSAPAPEVSTAATPPTTSVAQTPTTTAPSTAKPTHRRRKTRPRPGTRRRHVVRAGLPWRGNGVSYVARARDRRLAVYASPHARHPALLLDNPDGNGTPRVVLVRAERGDWVRVYLPTRPNGHEGWVRARAVRLLRNPYRLVVRLHAHRIILWKRQRVVLSARTVVGASSTPTPLGMYYIVELLRPPDPNGSYGPYSFGISAHSNVLKRFAGGDGRVGIHGTNEPGLIGQSVSHGCVRVRNETIRRLARVLPLGTPVLIRT